MDDRVILFEKEMSKIKKDFLKNIQNYKDYLNKCTLDAPIEVLCLDKATLGILKNNGIHRLFHLSTADLTKIKGLGNTRILKIESRLQQFIFV